MSGLLFAALAGAVLVAAGCGAGTKPPPVASLGATTATSGGATGSSSAFALPPGGAAIGTSISTEVGRAAGVRYTDCMRSHGVSGFPDPDSEGVLTITVSTSLNPSSPVFRRAEAHCQHLLPAGKAPSPAQQQRMRERALAFAACMRSHGVSQYPDPTFSNGGVSQDFSWKDGIDPSSPLFQTARKTCQESRAGG